MDGAKMVYVPTGKFLMGSTLTETNATLEEWPGTVPRQFNGERPQHEMSVNAFWIDQTEVTNAQYQRCVNAGKCTKPQSAESRTREEYYGNAEFDDYPVINVSWEQARLYAEWVGGQLPNEVQWEYACRAGEKGRKYPWGAERPGSQYANYDIWKDDTTAVLSYPKGAGRYGTLNMAGNVWEWTRSLSATYSYDPTDGRENEIPGGDYVIRGGAFGFNGYYIRCAFRNVHNDQYTTLDVIGFRVVCRDDCGRPKW
jgi:formylglycine-generating enzyme required for sulfatase activity